VTRAPKAHRAEAEAGSRGPGLTEVRAGYPVSLSLDGRRVLVVGGGRVATRRVEGLIATGASIDVVAPAVSQEIAGWADQGQVSVALRPFEAGDVAGAWLCVAATDDPAVNRSVVVAAEGERCFVSAAGDATASSARPMSVFRRGDLEVAVGTSGRAPAAAAWICRHLATLVGPEYGILIDLVAEARADAGSGANWPAALDSGILESIRAGRLEEARKGLRTCLSSSSG
jgi:precorrin-2 dehydrogenase / sirohydrochlorin ferrochelatase